jgi:hypothetical protein
MGFDLAQLQITSIAIPKATVFGLNENWIKNDLTPAKTRWTNAWEAYQPKLTRTHIITSEKIESRLEYQPMISQLISMLTASPTVTKNDLDLMGIRLRDKRPTPSPIPSTFVKAKFEATIHRIIVHYSDQGSIRLHSGRKRGKPFGVHGCSIRWGILTEIPATVNELLNFEFSTRSPFIFDFPADHSGRMLYIAFCWENTRGQQGPWSQIYSCAIP